ncbi:MAG TPA: cell division protein ZipA C-terminal FtsZ-binding domain-containing protein [Casimicrobiaceae bacterium]|nr:cell division protein ZipA C-terminal FtsZ-binding domain-containing protein [Casimicrobiaceae bacterium]
MRLSTLQIGLIVAGLLLVVGVLAYNAWQLRRARGRLVAPMRPSPGPRGDGRVEPTLADGRGPATGPNSPVQAGGERFEIPMEATESIDGSPADDDPLAVPITRSSMSDPPAAQGTHPQPDPEIESVVTLQPARPVAVGALAAGLHARLGKPLRWFGRRDAAAAWQRVTGDTPGEFGEFAACLLLADRNGGATRAQIEAFHQVIAELAPQLPAAWSAATAEDEAVRAEELDRLCAELDMQVGLTIQKGDGSAIPGTKLRGVAEAAGFRLAPTGRFECVQEETGAVLYTLQDAKGEPFTADAMRVSSFPGVVLVLDVPRVGDPPRAFDQLKLAAKRMAQTLGGELVDDNQRPLTDAALAAIRTQVTQASELLARAQIDPGSPRAHKLFAA